MKVSSVLTSSALGTDQADTRQQILTVTPNDNCLLLVNPMSYAKPKGCPIIFVVSLLLSQAANGPNVADLQALARMLSQRCIGQ